MRKNLPQPQHEPAPTGGPTAVPPDADDTRRFTGRAILDIRRAIAAAKDAAATPVTAGPPESAAAPNDAPPEPAHRPAWATATPTTPPPAVLGWADDLAPMAAEDGVVGPEVTQRYADRGAAGIRAAIAAARAAQTDPDAAPSATGPRAAARLAFGQAAEVKVPSLILDAAPAPAQQPAAVGSEPAPSARPDGVDR